MGPEHARNAAIDAARCAAKAAQHLVGPSAVVEIAAGDVRIIIRRVEPPATVEKPPTPCERAILDLLALAPMPLTTSRVLHELGHAHGETTIRHTLARLVKAGKIVSRKRPPRGYRLPPEARVTSA